MLGRCASLLSKVGALGPPAKQPACGIRFRGQTRVPLTNRWPWGQDTEASRTTGGGALPFPSWRSPSQLCHPAWARRPARGSWDPSARPRRSSPNQGSHGAVPLGWVPAGASVTEFPPFHRSQQAREPRRGPFPTVRPPVVGAGPSRGSRVVSTRRLPVQAVLR